REAPVRPAALEPVNSGREAGMRREDAVDVRDPPSADHGHGAAAWIGQLRQHAAQPCRRAREARVLDDLDERAVEVEKKRRAAWPGRSSGLGHDARTSQAGVARCLRAVDPRSRADACPAYTVYSAKR